MAGLIAKVKTIHRQATTNRWLHVSHLSPPPAPRISQHTPPLPSLLPIAPSSTASPFLGTLLATLPNFLMQSVGMPNSSLNTSNPIQVRNEQFLQTFLASILFCLFCAVLGISFIL
jgi:hypothetical protein